MKKIYTVSGFVLLAVLLQSGMRNGAVPPPNRTGATGAYCNACHGGGPIANPINTGGGSITVIGLPTSGGYVAGQSYPFSVTITHGTADRLRWGFSIAARNADSAQVGTFSSTNLNAAVNNRAVVNKQELSHFNAVVQPTASNTFTYDNLMWTAPAAGSPAVGPVTFFYAGNAANGNLANTGDFIYAGSSSTALPINLKDFTAAVLTGNSVNLKWNTVSEQNSDYFEIEKSDDGQFFFTIAKIIAAGNTAAEKAYSYTDKTITSYNKPVFYRLKLTDKDGTYKLSKTVSVQLKNGSLFVQNLYPTLVRNNGKVTANIVSADSRTVQMDVIDIAGRVLQTYTEKLVPGTNLIDFRLPVNLPAEWVFVRFTSPGLKQVMPLIVHE